jgi:hypothetical protein
MKPLRSKVWLAVLASGLILGLAGIAQAAPDTPPTFIAKQKRKAWSAAELGFGGTIVADGVTFLGPVLTVQGGHYRPLVGVFQLGVGVVLYNDPIPDQVYAATDPQADPTERNALVYIGLGVRVRIFQLEASLRDRPFDLYVGPLAMVFGNHDLVTFGVAGELGFAVHFGRLRISLSVHGGYQSVMHQYANADEYEFRASHLVGGQLSVGLQFK